MSDDPYAALGLSKSASDDDIRKAYRKIAKTSHPDLNPDDPEAEARFKAASAAYDLLKDPEQRARFDRGEIDATGAERPDRQFYRDYAGAGSNPYRSGHPFEDFDASDIFSEFMRQNAGARGGAGDGYRRASGRAYDVHMRGSDRYYTLEVPFLEAATGGKTRIVLPGGDALEVRIPQGAADGQTIRLRGKGDPGYGDGTPGDALVTLTVSPHPLFRRDGQDIHITLPVTLDEAILGAKVAVPTIDGHVNVTVPKGASSGKVLRLRGRGVQPGGTGKKGDQLVELSIVMPPEIDEDLTRFMQEWRTSHAYDPRKGMKP